MSIGTKLGMTVAAVALRLARCPPKLRQRNREEYRTRHGAFADGSSWAKSLRSCKRKATTSRPSRTP